MGVHVIDIHAVYRDFFLFYFSWRFRNTELLKSIMCRIIDIYARKLDLRGKNDLEFCLNSGYYENKRSGI